MEVNNKIDSYNNEVEKESNQKSYSDYTYEYVQQMIQQTKLNCQKTMEACSKSIQTIGESLKTIDNTRSDIENFCDQYKQAMSKLCEKIGDSFQSRSQVFKKNESSDMYEDSKESTVDESVKMFKGKKKVIFLTGAGISYASGIPTFRGVGASELFEKNGIIYKNEEISTYNFLKNQPDIFWERNIQFLGGMVGKKPNISHIRIQQLLNYYREQSQNKANEIQTQAVIITQNTDSLHCKAFNELNPKNTNYMNENDENYGFCPDVFEVHGSKSYLRCDNQNCSEYEKRFKHPEKFDTYKELARPNVLYFDEAYDEKNYKIQTIKEIIKDMDLLICIGTQLETGFAASLVGNAVRGKIPIIEICLTPVIEKGSITLKGKAEEIVPELCEKLMNLNEKPQVQQNSQLITNNKSVQKTIVPVITQRKSISSTTSTISTQSTLSNISNKTQIQTKTVTSKTSATTKPKLSADLTNKKTTSVQNKLNLNQKAKIVKK